MLSKKKASPAIPSDDVKTKKPKKKGCLTAIIVLIVLAVIASVGSGGDSSDAPAQSQSATISATESKNPSFSIIAGEQGEYGELITLNKDTEFEETYYVYRIPAGTYTVTNAGEYPSQFNVYGDTICKTEEGWDELSDSYYVKVLEVGGSDTVTISDGQIIEIHEPGHFKLEKIG